MQFDLWTFGLQTINFIILVWLLKIFLYQPILNVIKLRQSENRAAMDKAELSKKEAEKERENYKSRTANIELERDHIIAEARVVESRAYDKLISDGQSELGRLRELAKRDIERGKIKASAEMQQYATELAVTLAQHILQESSPNGINEVFLDRVVDYLQSMPAADFKNLQDQLSGGVLTVISAEHLGNDLKDRWRVALTARFERKIKMVFEVDESLLAGVNVQFPDGLLNFNWNDILEQAKEMLNKQVEHT